MKNEIKVGIFGVVALSILIWGYNFLKGKNLLSGDIIVTAEFTSVGGLDIAAPVTINGYKVGAVTNIGLREDYSGVVDVELSFRNDVSVPKNAKATLVQPSLMGGKEVALVFKGKCEGGNCATNGDILKGEVSSMFDDAMDMAGPYLKQVESIVTALEQVLDKDNNALAGTMQEMEQVMKNVKVITDQVNNLLLSASVNISLTMANLQDITKNIKNSNEQITSMLNNINDITGQIKDADLKATIDEAKGMLTNVNEMIDGVDVTLKKANGAIDNVTELLDFKQHEGLLGALFHDGKFKDDVKVTISDVQALVVDIREHPERYRTVLSGKYKPYTPPAQDDKLKKHQGKLDKKNN
ncbi:MAG: MCE family protein [Aureispira sp.]|nr:MCE family protein [Aureispira sp.]